jgi:DNA (cytosine-5)-methyltransferase 1
MSKLTAVSLFSGAGGFCEGVRLAGYQVLCAVEADPYACETHSSNFPEVPLFRGDIVKFLKAPHGATPSGAKVRAAVVDLVYGGPPCQGFSQIGPRNLKDPRNLLYREFVRVVRELQPRAFVMENVPNILALKNGHYRKLILNAFRRAGYGQVAVTTLVASDYGVPQDRRRVFFIGVRDGLRLHAPLEEGAAEALAEQKCGRPITVWEAISDLPVKVSEDDLPIAYPPRPSGGCTPYQKLMRLDCQAYPIDLESKRHRLAGGNELFNHHTKDVRARRKKIIQALKPGALGDSLPKALWRGTRAHKWRRLHPNRPSYTILAQMHRDLSEWVHPKANRWITVREAARLQSFHDGFVFKGSEWQQLKQVGNAVPPLVGFAVANAIREVLRKSQPPARRG